MMTVAGSERRTVSVDPAGNVAGSRSLASTVAVPPALLNVEEVQTAMGVRYPPPLSASGIGGTVTLYLLIDVDGIVQDCWIQTSSGHESLDDAAVSLSDVPRFSPARNQEGEAVSGWFSFPVVFQAR